MLTKWWFLLANSFCVNIYGSLTEILLTYWLYDVGRLVLGRAFWLVNLLYSYSIGDSIFYLLILLIAE